MWPVAECEVAERLITLCHERAPVDDPIPRQRLRTGGTRQQLDEIFPLGNAAQSAHVGLWELSEAVEPHVADLQIVACKQRQHPADVIRVDMRHHNDVEHPITRREGMNPRRECIRGLRRTAIDDHAPRTTGARALNPDGVSVRAPQHFHRDRGTHRLTRPPLES